MRMAKLANLERGQLLVESASRPALQAFIWPNGAPLSTASNCRRVCAGTSKSIRSTIEMPALAQEGAAMRQVRLPAAFARLIHRFVCGAQRLPAIAMAGVDRDADRGADAQFRAAYRERCGDLRDEVGGDPVGCSALSMSRSTITIRRHRAGPPHPFPGPCAWGAGDLLKQFVPGIVAAGVVDDA